MKILAITCTGARPEAWELCKKYMFRQTRVPDRWIILDDCLPRSEMPNADFVEVVHPEWVWNPRRRNNTIRNNLLLALEISQRVPHDICFLIEDDDWYAPNYIEFLTEVIAKNGGIAGLCHSYDYNVRFRGYRENHNNRHCTGASTAWSKEVTGRLIQILKENTVPTLDRFMWRGTRGMPQTKIPEHYFVGIKGMPGRGGTVRTHRQTHLVKPDPNMIKLREWIGDDAESYVRFYDEDCWDLRA